MTVELIRPVPPDLTPATDRTNANAFYRINALIDAFPDLIQTCRYLVLW